MTVNGILQMVPPPGKLTGGSVKLQVLMDGTPVHNKNWDTTQNNKATFNVTASGTHALAFYVDGTLIETISYDFS